MMMVLLVVDCEGVTGRGTEVSIFLPEEVGVGGTDE